MNSPSDASFDSNNDRNVSKKHQQEAVFVQGLARYLMEDSTTTSKLSSHQYSGGTYSIPPISSQLQPPVSVESADAKNYFYYYYNNNNNNNNNKDDEGGSPKWMDTMTSTSIGGLNNPFSSSASTNSNPFNPKVQQQQLYGDTTTKEKEDLGSDRLDLQTTGRMDCDRSSKPKRQYQRVDNQTKLNDSKYHQRREKNNEAVRRNRMVQKAKSEETEKQLKELVAENEQLQYQLNLCHVQLQQISKQNEQQKY